MKGSEHPGGTNCGSQQVVDYQMVFAFRVLRTHRNAPGAVQQNPAPIMVLLFCLPIFFFFFFFYSGGVQ